MLLEGKKIIITGGASGIGKATVLGCVREGAAVVLFDIVSPTDPKVIKVIEDAKKLGSGPIMAIQVDITKQTEVNESVKKAIDFMGGVTGIVNCAGKDCRKPAEEHTAEDFYAMFNVHLLGTHFMCVAAYNWMKTHGGGSIVNYVSHSGIIGSPTQEAYGTAKGAVLHYSRLIATDWGRSKVRVNMVAPVVLTEMAQSYLDRMPQEERARVEMSMRYMIPLTGYWGKPEEAANLNIFLLSDMASFIHGQLIGCDGGFNFTR